MQMPEGNIAPMTHEDHLVCVERLAKRLRSYPNVYFDVSNERNLTDPRHVPIGEVGELIQRVKDFDRDRICTASGVPKDIWDLNEYLEIGKLDFIAPPILTVVQTMKKPCKW